MERVEHTFTVLGNILEIIPDTPPQDNSIYEIYIKSVKSASGKKTLNNIRVKVCTQLRPSYCSLEAVKSLVESYSISDERVLYYIREASRFADYVREEEIKETDVPYEVTQYVKYKAAYDSLLRSYIDMASESGQKGTLGEISFENVTSYPAMKDLLKALKEEVDKWELHIRGYGIEGRAKPKSAVRGIKHNPYRTRNMNLIYPPYGTILEGYERDVDRS